MRDFRTYRHTRTFITHTDIHVGFAGSDDVHCRLQAERVDLLAQHLGLVADLIGRRRLGGHVLAPKVQRHGLGLRTSGEGCMHATVFV